MARRKKTGAGELILIGLVGVIALISAVPKEVWVLLGIVGGVWLIARLYTQSKRSAPEATDTDIGRFATTTPQRGGRYVDDDTPVGVSRAASPASSDFRIPPAPKTFGNARWIPPGESVDIAGVTLHGGMLYVGTSLPTPMGDNDPCLIDPSKPLAVRGDYTIREMGYWPSYAEISKTARRAYLSWLAGGRSDPEADIGFVFLYFYGLERRAIVDATKDKRAQADWPVITAELRRLLGIYGESSHAFRRYAGALLDWVASADYAPKLYDKPVPSFPKTFEVPLYVRLALGQAALDGAPIPAQLALAWVRLDPSIALRTPATRCVEEFDRLFTLNYTDTFGDGLKVPRNRTKLKLVYRPASAGFLGYKDIELTFGETPDVTVLTAPVRKLQQVVESTTQELNGFSRFLGKNPNAKASLEGLLLLPVSIWPSSARRELRALLMRAPNSPVLMPYQALLDTLGAKSPLTKDKTLSLAKALAAEHIGLVPDVLYGAKAPKPDEMIALFSLPEADNGPSPAYQAALLTLQLASAVAAADGDHSDDEFEHLKDKVGTWSHLAAPQGYRLLAHLHLLRATPVSIGALKKKLEPLETSAKETIAAFMATVAQSDGTVTPAEVKILEKIYKALGIDAKKVFSDIHAVAVGSTASTTTEAAIETSGFRLDPARITALQKDTERVSALLGTIFTEEESGTSAVVTSEPEAEPEAEPPPAGILGLDETHTALARMLLSRPAWSRGELLDMAADLELMLDGALEQINDAAFDAHDIPFTEGEDPVEVNPDILEKVAA